MLTGERYVTLVTVRVNHLYIVATSPDYKLVTMETARATRTVLLCTNLIYILVHKYI